MMSFLRRQILALIKEGKILEFQIGFLKAKIKVLSASHLLIVNFYQNLFQKI